MNERVIDLNLFRVFAEVWHAQSLTQAAKRLRLTQPAVSNALTRLRTHLEDPLFVRHGRRMVPTARARALAPEVLAALAALSRATSADESSFAPDQSIRRFTVGMREAVESALVPELGRLICARGVGLSLHSVRFERKQLPRLLASGALDVAVDIRMPAWEGVRVKSLFREQLCLVMRAGHPLSGKVDRRAFLSARHVAVSARPRGTPFEDVVLAEQGLERQVAVRCQHYSSACALVAETDLLLVAPGRYVELSRAHFALETAPLPIPLSVPELWLYWHERADHDPGVRWLVEQLLQLRIAQSPLR